MPHRFAPSPAASTSPRASIVLTAAALSCSLLLHGSVPVVFDRAVPEPEDRPVEVAVHWVEPETPTPEEGATEDKPEAPTHKPARPPTPKPPEAQPPLPEPEPAEEDDVGVDEADEAPPAEAPPTEPTADDEAPAPEPAQQATDTEPPPEVAEEGAPDEQSSEASEEASAPDTQVAADEAPRKLVRQRVDRRRFVGQAQLARKELLARHRLLAEQRRRLAKRRAQLAEERAKALADKERRDRERRLAKLSRARAKKQRTPPPELKQGNSDEVWACEAHDRGFRAGVKAEEPITDWVSLVPTVMFSFPTEPGLTGYMEGVSRIKKRDRRYVNKLGTVELALPSTPIDVAFEDPGGTVGRLGRGDARCLVGFKWNGKKLWPFTVTRMPAELIDEEGHTLRALVDVTFFEDATFELKAHREQDGPLAISKGRLEGGDFIENTIATHLRAAKMATSVSQMIGIDLRRFSETGRRHIAYEKKVKEKRAQQQREREANKRAQERKAAERKARTDDDKANKRAVDKAKKRPARDRRAVHRMRPASYPGSDAR